MPLRLNGDAVAPERGCRFAGTRVRSGVDGVLSSPPNCDADASRDRDARIRLPDRARSVGRFYARNENAFARPRPRAGTVRADIQKRGCACGEKPAERGLGKVADRAVEIVRRERGERRPRIRARMQRAEDPVAMPDRKVRNAVRHGPMGGYGGQKGRGDTKRPDLAHSATRLCANLCFFASTVAQFRFSCGDGKSRGRLHARTENATILQS